MKMHYIPLVLFSLFALCGCSDSTNEEKEIFDIEWNKDLSIEENTMYYLEDEGPEYTANIKKTDVCLFPIDNLHYMKIEVDDNTFCFYWYDEKQEISPGIVQLYPYGYSKEEDDFYTNYRGMLNIIEVSKGEWNEDLSQTPLEAERDIYIKAVFHYKKEICKKKENNDVVGNGEIIGNGEIKGVFHFSGVEKTGIFLED